MSAWLLPFVWLVNGMLALVWLLGSADDLADWVALWGRRGWVTRRVGEGLRIYTTNRPYSELLFQGRDEEDCRGKND